MIAVRIAALLCCAAMAAAVWSASASAAVEFTHPYLSSFGSFFSVQGVATDASGDVYVFDGGAATIFKFDAAGDPVSFSATGTNEITGVYAGGGSENEIAVDNSTGATAGDIYIANGSRSTVQIFSPAGSPLTPLSPEAGIPWSGEACGVAVDPSGNVYIGVYSGQILKYIPTGNPVTNANYSSAIGGAESPCNIAVDQAGNVFSEKYSEGPITRYEPSQFGSSRATGSIIDSTGSSLAVDPANQEVYVDEQSQVAQFGVNGKPVSTFAATGEGAISGSYGVAVGPVNHDVYVSDGSGKLSVFGPGVSGHAPTVTTGSASEAVVAGATLNGTVNPEGAPVSECFFEYGETSSYGKTVPCAESPEELGSGNAPVAVHANVTGLTGAESHFRLVAAQTVKGFGGDSSFSLVAPAVEDETASNVSATSATLQARLNAEGSATSYRFEYGTSASYGASAPTLEGEIGSAISGTSVSVHIQGLAASTVYHYRVAATSIGRTTYGADLTFTTEPPGEGLVLPDGRQWELVSPPNKHGALIEAGRAEGGALQAAAEGGSIAYYASAPVTAEPAGSRSPEPVDVLSKRTANGWTTQDLTTPNNEANGVIAGRATEYRAFSSDLSLGLLEAPQDLPLSPEATEWTPYLHDDASGSYRPLVSAANVPPGTEFGQFETGSGQLQFEGASPDLTHVVLSSKVPLTENAVGAGLYEWFEGRLQLISVLPGAEDKPAGGTVGGGLLYVGDGLFGSYRRIHAISTDGSRVAFVGIDPESGERHLYLRDVALGQTVQIDAGGESGGATFRAASADGSKIIFTDSSELTPGYTGNLYQCEVKVLAGKLTCELSDLSPVVASDVIDVSEDGAYVYFVENNEEIYLAHNGTTSLVAVPGPLGEAYFGDPPKLTARVSPNGRYLAFLSTRSLTGYDNRDAVSGERDTEVYLYDAGSGDLICASCDPTGARPVGLYIASGETAYENVPLVDRPETFAPDTWVSGSVPGWTRVGEGGPSLYQSRYLDDSGRLFFDSTDALVPQDVNGLEDAYEYEPEGVGSCAHEGGCVSLISSGSSQVESVFLDASENGDDVFFATAQPLVSLDADHAIDMYDAHVCSTGAPCVSEPVAPPPCESGDSCKAAPSPQPEIFGAPSSATFNGQGNVATVEAKSVKASPKQKPKSALRACEVKYRHNRHRRELCKRRVRSARAKHGAHGAAAHRRNVKASKRGNGR